MSKRVEFLSNPADAEPLFAEALAMIVSSNYTAEEAKLVAHQALYQNSRNFLHSMVSSIGADEALEIRKTVE